MTSVFVTIAFVSFVRFLKSQPRRRGACNITTTVPQTKVNMLFKYPKQLSEGIGVFAASQYLGYGPKTKVNDILIFSHPSITNLQHVRI